MKQTYKAIFFDWDGTLVHQSGLIAKGHNAVRSFFGLAPYDKDDAVTRGHQSTRELYPILFGDNAPKAEKMFYDFFLEHHLSDLEAFDDTPVILNELNVSGIPLGVVSNKRHFFLTREIEHMGWTALFKSILGAGEATRDKPSPDPLLLGIERLDKSLLPSDVLYVGDTETDLKCAKAAGCAAALILRGRSLDSLIDTYQPEITAQTLVDMLEILDNSEFPTIKKNA